MAGRAAPARGTPRPAEGDARGADSERRRPHAHAGALAEDARDRGAACVAHSALLPLLAEITPEHFESAKHRRFRDQLLNGGDDGDLVGLKAELDARVAREGIDERTGRQLLLRLRERRLRKDATEADPGRQREVAEAIARVRAAIEELSVERA